MKQRLIFLVLLLFNFFQTLNISVLPFFVLKISEDPNVYSLAFSLFSFGMFFGSIILGILADKYSRKYIVVTFIPVYAVLQVILPALQQELIFYIARFLSGFFLAGVVANTFPLLIETMEDFDKKIGDFTTYSSVLISLGTLLGGIMASYISYQSPLILQFILSFILSIFLFYTVPDQPTNKKLNPQNKIKVSSEQKLIFILNSGYIMIFFFLLQASRYILLTMMDITPAINGYISLYTGILGLLIGKFAYLPIQKRYGDFKVLYLGYMILCLGIISLNLSVTSIGMLVFLTLCIAPQNLVKIPLNVLLSNQVDDHKGYIFGINNALISLFSAFGSALVGPGIKYLGVNSLTLALGLSVILFPLTFLLNKRMKIQKFSS